jgi:hypothetical protein
VIGGNVDLDVLSLFPQKYTWIIGGMEDGGQACKVNNAGERNSICAQPKEEEGVFIPPPLQKCDRWGNLDRLFPASDRLFLAHTGFFRPKIWPKIRPPYRKVSPLECAGDRLFPAPDRLFPALRNWQKHQNKNGNNLSIQTPFSMILGSF